MREAVAADRDAVVALWQECGLTRPWNHPETDFDRSLGFAGSTVLVLEREGAIVASAMTGFDGHRGWIYYLAVAPRFRRQDLARKMISACEDWLSALGCPKVELMVRTGNPAEALYAALGWEKQEVSVWGRRLQAD